MNTINLRFEGVSPLIMHNGQLADPLNPIAKLLKKTTGKKTKTDEDHELMAKIEFLGSLYTSEPVDFEVEGYKISFKGDSKLCLPVEMLEAAIIEGAKKQKKGTQAKAAIFVEQNALLIDTPSIKRVFADQGNYFFRKRAVVSRSAVMRTRAIFRKWSCDVQVSYSPDLLNEADVRDAAVAAGRDVGIGTWRPKYGRFNVSVAR